MVSIDVPLEFIVEALRGYALVDGRMRYHNKGAFNKKSAVDLMIDNYEEILDKEINLVTKLETKITELENTLQNTTHVIDNLQNQLRRIKKYKSC